ncbi:MAG: GAF domain-containing protein [Armatimonadetes bacterium]|nr:GAF domain-containing protein [Armatimonadota bacterium]
MVSKSVEVIKQQAVRESAILETLSAASFSSLSLPAFAQDLLEAVSRVLGVPDCSLMIVNEDTGLLSIVAATGIDLADYESFTLRPGEGVAGWVIREGAPLVLPDVEKDPRFFPIPGKEGLMKSMLCVPLLVSGRAVGVLNVHKREHYDFPQEDIQVISGLAEKMAIAIDNLMQYQKAEEKERQLSCLNRVVAVTSQSQLPLEQLLRGIEKEIGSFFSCQVRGIYFFSQGLSGTEGRICQLKEDRATFERGCLASRELAPVIAEDVQTRNPCSLMRAEGVSSYLCLPLTAGDELLGILQMGTPKQGVFRRNDVWFLSTLSQLVAVAIHGFVMSQRLEGRVQELSTLYEVAAYELSAVMSSTSNLDDALRLTIEIVSRLLKAERVSIMLLDERTNELYFKATKGLDSMDFGLQRIPVGEGIPGWVIKTGRPYVTSDAPSDPKYLAYSLGREEIKSLLCMPMVVESRKIGVINVGTLLSHRSFSEDDLRTLNLIAHRAALAIENALLHQKHREVTEQLSQKNGKLELQSRELKDKGKELAATNMRLAESLESLSRANQKISTLLEIAHVLATTTLESDQIMREGLDKIASLVTAPISTLAFSFLEQDKRRFVVVSGRGLPQDQHRGFPVPFEEIAPEKLAVLIDEKRPLVVHDTANAPDLRRFVKGKVRSFYAFPLVGKKGVLGMFTLASPKQAALGDNDVRMIATVLSLVAVSLENATLYRNAVIEKNKLEAIMDSMGDGLLTLDWERRITSLNEATEKLLGWKGAEILGKRVEEVLKCRDAKGQNMDMGAILVQMMESALSAAEISKKFEVVVQTKDERDRILGAVISILHNESGDPVGGVLVLRDITQEKEVERMKSDFVATVSHDLRTPLTAVKGYAVTLLRHEERFDQPTKHEFLKVINSEIDRLKRLIDNILDWSKMEAGRLEIRKENFDIIPLAKKVVEVFRISTTKHEFVIDFPSDFSLVEADPDQLEQVMNNLVSNAIKYSPSGGEIRVSGVNNGESAIVSVSDCGMGIPSEQLDKIFERFHRVDSKATRKVSGTGLGLFITKSLVEAHGGKIWAESEVGKGTTFRFTLRAIPR